MKAKYLLPCSCGEKLPIDVGQAGQRIPCRCGGVLEAPTMRGIRQLEQAPADAESAGGASGGSWSVGQGVLFACGLLTAVVALAVVAGLLYQRLQLDLADPHPDEGLMADAQIDMLTVDESWDIWRVFVVEGLERPQPAEHVLARRRHRVLTRFLYAALVVSLVGAGAAASALLLRPRRPAAQRGEPP